MDIKKILEELRSEREEIERAIIALERQEQNVFQAGESGEPDVAEYPIDLRCPDRERLLREWIDCSNRLMRLQGEEFAAMRKGGTVSASLAERIRVARAADTKACRVYHQHVSEHGCGVWRLHQQCADGKVLR